MAPSSPRGCGPYMTVHGSIAQLLPRTLGRFRCFGGSRGPHEKNPWIRSQQSGTSTALICDWEDAKVIENQQNLVVLKTRCLDHPMDPTRIPRGVAMADPRLETGPAGENHLAIPRFFHGERLGNAPSKAFD